MSATSNLDKGLDEIIASTGISANSRTKTRAGRGFKKSRGGASTKTLGKAIAAAAQASNKSTDGKGKQQKSKNATAAAPQLPAGLVVNPLMIAKRVVVSNLPLDINEQAVRQYFSESVGKIREVVGSYRGDGTPSGTYTITFEKNGAANRMFEKFHNQPIDGGKAHLSVQILLDPSKAQPNTLKGRIGGAATTNSPAPAIAPAAGKKRRGNKRAGAKANTDKPIQAVASRKEPKKTQNSKNKPKTPKKKTRSAADLDAEMSDYFASAEKSEISV